MKKGAFVLAFLFALSLSLVIVSAANETTDDSDNTVDKGYTCLENSVKNSTMSFQNAVFASLALGSRTNIDRVISNEKKSSAYCWPKSSCTLKETAQVALVYYREGKSTDGIESWLLSKNGTMTDLRWYLEIDATNHKNATCTVKYDSTKRTVNIRDDMKLEADPTGCYDLSQNQYWLEINPSCYSKKFEITCTEDFVTTLLYTKSTGDTIFVSSETHSQASAGTTTEEIRAQCFKLGSTCDYEGSLWAVLALSKTGNDISSYLPYLIALADDNTRYFPDSFLYLFGIGQDSFTKLVNSQKSSKYWEISGSPGGRYYDTSLAMMALSGNPTTQLDNAKDYLLSIQSKDGCWNNGNIRDTAFLLYAGWPREATGSGDGSGISMTCASAGKTCAKAADCSDSGGSVLTDYSCSSFGEFCCSVAVQIKSCTAQEGKVCSSNQVCNGRSVSSLDGACCIGDCGAKPVEETCTIGDGVCRDNCDDNEEEIPATCSTDGNVCCRAKTTDDGGGGHLWLWIFLFIVLIILVALAIVYRDRLKLEFLKLRGKAQSSPVKRAPPSSPPSFPMGQRPMPRPGMFSRPGVPVGRPMPPVRPNPSMPPRPSSAPRDKDMEETLRKLREMSK